MDDQLCRLLRTTDQFIVDQAIDLIKTISKTNKLDVLELNSELNDMNENDLIELKPRKQTKSYMILRIFLKIMTRQINSSKIEEKRDSFYKKNNTFNELDQDDDTERLEDILTKEEQQHILLKYKLEKMKKINIVQQKTLYDTAHYIVNYFTPLIFPIVEDRIWERLERSTPLHEIPQNSNVFVQSLPLKYDESRIDDWLEKIVMYMDNYFAEHNPTIQYSIQEDENYQINWIYLIVRFNNPVNQCNE